MPSLPPPAAPDAALPTLGASACLATRAVLAEHLDGEAVAGGVSRAEVDGHLAECPRCRVLAHQLRAQRVALAALAARSSGRSDEAMTPTFRARMDALLTGGRDADVSRAG